MGVWRIQDAQWYREGVWLCVNGRLRMRSGKYFHVLGSVTKRYKQFHMKL